MKRECEDEVVKTKEVQQDNKAKIFVVVVDYIKEQPKADLKTHAFYAPNTIHNVSVV